MLFKMLGIERAWEARRDSMSKPRQLFVTQSRVLAEKVEEYFVKLLESLSTAAQSPTELVKIAKRKKQQQEQGLVDRDEEIYWRGDLPMRYSALQDEHFPMFVTYDHVHPRSQSHTLCILLTTCFCRFVDSSRASSIIPSSIKIRRRRQHALCKTHSTSKLHS